MLFHTARFLMFFAVVFALYWRLGRRAQNVLLLLASYLFYSFLSWRFVALIALVTLVDYGCGIRIVRAPSRRVAKTFLGLSLFTNLAILGFFKYFGFFLDNVADVLSWLGVHDVAPLHLHILLPVGLSFYTFQSMSYTIDLYRKVGNPARGLLDYALFLAFFPKLLAGPIERARHLLPQIEAPRRLTAAMFEEGVYLFAWGLFKKMVIADNVAIAAGEFLRAGTRVNGLEFILGAWLLAFRVYADFSGYTDMARGLARLLGFNLSMNFNLPYFARTPPEIWRRWHMSLSNWVRDYVFFSLGGMRARGARLFGTLVLTMVVMGLWHSASWNYVLWGVYHGTILSIYGLLKRASPRVRMPAVLSGVVVSLQILLVFTLKAVGEVIAMRHSVRRLAEYVAPRVLDLSASPRALDWALQLAVFCLPLMALEWCQLRKSDTLLVLKWRAPYKTAFALALLYIAVGTIVFGTHAGSGTGGGFVYFQF